VYFLLHNFKIIVKMIFLLILKNTDTYLVVPVKEIFVSFLLFNT